MLYTAKHLKDFRLQANDGEIGWVKEFYFDDVRWNIRYIIVDTGNWLEDRQALISPNAIKGVDNDKKHISVSCTKTQIEESPPLQTDMPISRSYEETYYNYYDWPMYWNGPFMWGAYPYSERDSKELAENTGNQNINPNLQSTLDVAGSYAQATDGEIGHVDDFVIDDETWGITYLIVDTGGIWPGKRVLIPPKKIKDINWDESKVYVKLSMDDIKNSPENFLTKGGKQK